MGIGAHHEQADVMNSGGLKESISHVLVTTLHGRELRLDAVPRQVMTEFDSRSAALKGLVIGDMNDHNLACCAEKRHGSRDGMHGGGRRIPGHHHPVASKG